jgi:uncharacterized protein YukE
MSEIQVWAAGDLAQGCKVVDLGSHKQAVLEAVSAAVSARDARIERLAEANEYLTDRLNETRSYWIGQVEPQFEEQYAARLAAAKKLADAVDAALAAFRASLSRCR